MPLETEGAEWRLGSRTADLGMWSRAMAASVAVKSAAPPGTAFPSEELAPRAGATAEADGRATSPGGCARPACPPSPKAGEATITTAANATAMRLTQRPKDDMARARRVSRSIRVAEGGDSPFESEVSS